MTPTDDDPVITPIDDITLNVGESIPAAIDLEFQEFDLGEGHTVTINFGDGSTPETLTTSLDAAGGNVNQTTLAVSPDEHLADIAHTFDTVATMM